MNSDGHSLTQRRALPCYTRNKCPLDACISSSDPTPAACPAKAFFWVCPVLGRPTISGANPNQPTRAQPADAAQIPRYPHDSQSGARVSLEAACYPPPSKGVLDIASRHFLAFLPRHNRALGGIIDSPTRNEHADGRTDRPWPPTSAPRAGTQANQSVQKPDGPDWRLTRSNCQATGQAIPAQNPGAHSSPPARSDSPRRRAKEFCRCATGGLVKGLLACLHYAKRRRRARPFAHWCYRIGTSTGETTPAATGAVAGPTYDILTSSATNRVKRAAVHARRLGACPIPPV